MSVQGFVTTRIVFYSYIVLSFTMGRNRPIVKLYGALTDNKFVGNYGHFDDGYWDDRQNLMKEAFANFLVHMQEETRKNFCSLKKHFPYQPLFSRI